MYGLADKVEAAGVRIITGVTVTGFKQGSQGSIQSVETDKGDISTDYVVIGAGPWARQFWEPILSVEFKKCTITHSILKGDKFCAWDYHLPE